MQAATLKTTQRSQDGQQAVAVLDADGPPGIAFIRSLGARGIPVDAYGHRRFPAGRFSRHVRSYHRSPSPYETDRYVEWLAEEFSSGRIRLVAPTSDYVVFAVAEAMDLAEIAHSVGMPSSDVAWNSLHKGQFGEAMESVGFPTLPYRLPTSAVQALEAADELGYPVVLKPRSHVGVGLYRGSVAHDASQLAESFQRLDVGDECALGLARDPDLGWPLLQHYVDNPHIHKVSVAGCIGADGEVLAAGLSRTMAQSPPRVGIGTMFEALAPSPIVDRAVDAVRMALGPGLFEIEVCVDRETGDAWPIDLNPRAYGQISLEIARGNDLPALWYQLVTGVEQRDMDIASPVPEVWQAGVMYYASALGGLFSGPNRRAQWSEIVAHAKRPRVGSVFQWKDPIPAIVLSAHTLRNPRALIRPFLSRRPS